MEEQINLLIAAIWRDDIDTFKRVWTIEVTDETFGTPRRGLLHEANDYNRYEIAKFMLENGADPNLQGEYNDTPMVYGWSPYDTMRKRMHLLFLKHGANPYIEDISENRVTGLDDDYTYSYLLVELVTGKADSLSLDLWRVIKPFIYHI